MNTPFLLSRASRPSIARAMMLGVALFSVVACSNDDDPTSVRAIVNIPVVTITPGAVTLRPGATQQFTAEVRDGATKNVISGSTVEWKSADSLIARVSATGLVTVVGPGTAGITAKYGAGIGVVSVTVLGAVNSVTVSAGVSSLALGATTQLTTRALDASGAAQSREVAYTSSAPNVASVSNTGLVTAIAAGSTTITATSEGRSGTVLITVLPPIPITLTPATFVLGRTQTQQITALLRDPLTGAVQTGTPTYTTSDATVATVSATGLVTFVSTGSGTATITGTFNGNSASVAVTNIATSSIGYTIAGALNSTISYYINVPAGATRLTVTLTNSTADDADIEVYNAANTKLGESGNAASNESVIINSPLPGLYRVAVIGYTVYSNVTFRATVQ